ncbi:MAG: hypothetical protein ACRDZ2_04850, partial [Ilumatobacteraceae bacterium]
MQMTKLWQALRSRASHAGGPKRLLAVGSVAILLGQCGPGTCTPPPPPPPPSGYFGWVAIGGVLPSDATCAARV